MGKNPGQIHNINHRTFCIDCFLVFNSEQVFFQKGYRSYKFQIVVEICASRLCLLHFLQVDFLSLNESACQARKNAFYFPSKTLFVLEEIKF